MVLAFIMCNGIWLIYLCYDHLLIGAYSDVRYVRDKGDQKLTMGFYTC